MQTIARLDAETRQWTNVGSLVNARYDHGAIFDGRKFLIVGGGGTKNTEVCDLRKVFRENTCLFKKIFGIIRLYFTLTFERFPHTKASVTDK